MKTASTIALVLLLCACGNKGEDKTGDESAQGEKDKPAEGDKDKAAGGDKSDANQEAAGGTDDSVGSDALCGCRLLTKFSLEDLEKGKHEQLCAGDKLVDDDADCEQFDMMRNCIYAHHGNKFKTKKWKSYFAKQDWYKPSDDFKEKDFTKLERDNIRALKTRAATCKSATGGKVTGADIKLVKKWFKNRKKEVPGIILHEAEDAAGTAEDIESRIGYFKLDKKNVEFRYSKKMPDERLEKQLAGKNTRAIEVGDCYECDEDDMDCEGGCDTFYLIFDDKNKVVAIYLTVAAACPFVYASSANAPLELEGEILRNLNQASLEGTQSLRLDVDCSAPIAVRLSEEKPEITLLDQIYLDVDGRRVDPTTCSESRAYCADDGAYRVLHQGEMLDLRFDVPAGTCDRVRLIADGYYVPR